MENKNNKTIKTQEEIDRIHQEKLELKQKTAFSLSVSSGLSFDEAFKLLSINKSITKSTMLLFFPKDVVERFGYDEVENPHYKSASPMKLYDVQFVITKIIELDLPIKIKSNINTDGNDSVKYCFDILSKIQKERELKIERENKKELELWWI